MLATFVVMVTAISSFAYASQPELVAAWPEGPALAVAKAGDLALIASGRTLRAYDVSDLAAPVELASIVLPGAVRDLELADGYVYAAVQDSGLAIVDARQPQALVLAATVALPPFGATDLALVTSPATVLVTTAGGGIVAFDVSNPAAPINLGSSLASTSALSVAVDDNLAFVAEFDRLRIFDLVTFPSVTELGSIVLNDVASDRVLAVADNRVYTASTFMGWGGELRVIDISEPSLPRLISRTSGAAGGYGIAVDPVAGIVVSASRDLLVTSVADPAVPALVGVYETSARVEDVTVDDGLVLAAAGAGGAHLVDLTDPTVPAALAVVATAGAARELTWDGDTLLVTTDGGERRLLTAGDQGPLVELARLAHPEGATWSHAVAANGILYDASVVVTLDDDGETRHVRIRTTDITDPTNPAPLGTLDVSGSDSGLALTADLLLVATGDTVHVIDVADPASPTELGHHATDAYEVEAAGHSLALAYGYARRLEVIDIADPANPVGLADLEFSGRLVDVTAGPGHLAYAVHSDGSGGHFLTIVDLQDPTAPAARAVLPLAAAPAAIAALDAGRVAVALLPRELAIVDTSLPARPAVIAISQAPGVIRDLAFNGELLAVAGDAAGVTLWNLSGVVAGPAHSSPRDID